MALSEARLELVADRSTWWLRPPAGEPLNLQLLGAKQADALQRLLSQRWVACAGRPIAAFPCSHGLLTVQHTSGYACSC